MYLLSVNLKDGELGILNILALSMIRLNSLIKLTTHSWFASLPNPLAVLITIKYTGINAGETGSEKNDNFINSSERINDSTKLHQRHQQIKSHLYIISSVLCEDNLVM